MIIILNLLTAGSAMTYGLEWCGKASRGEESRLESKKLDCQLELLDLSDNNIWGLPASSLCHTPTLTSLNLSRNNVVEVLLD